MTQPHLIAIDVGKTALQIQTSARAFRVPNDAAGWRKIIADAAQHPHALVVCEASGGYERPFLHALGKADVAFRFVNPARVRGFATSEGWKAKTDPIDAKLIYRFAEEKKLQPLSLPSAQEQRLAELMDRRNQLTTLIAREKNHLEKAPKEMAASCKRILRALEHDVEKFEKLIRELVAKEPILRAQAQSLCTVNGVGEVTAWSILAYLREITHLSRNRLVALAGLAPYNRDSGTICAKRRILGGRSKVRRHLYMAAHTAALHNPVIKPYKCAIVAAMRKLLIHLQLTLRKSAESPLAT